MSFSLRLVLVRPRNPLNIGAAARAMANFGFDDLAVVAPYRAAWREAKSARAGAPLLQRALCCDDLPTAVADCQHVVGTTAGTNRLPEMPLASWPEVADALPPLRCALLFGSEKTGLSVEDIGHCHQLARIPTLPSAPSLNLGQAVALCCYQLRLRGLAAVPASGAATDAATQVETERVVARFQPLLEHVGVFRPQHRLGQARRLRAMLLRWRLTTADARLLLGVAREFRRVLRLPPLDPPDPPHR